MRQRQLLLYNLATGTDLNGVLFARMRNRQERVGMHQFPHHYSVVAKADTQGDVALEGERLPSIASAPPTEFGGPGDRWSPETLFVAAVVDCFVLTFRGIAGVSRFPWVSLECNVTGTVDRRSRHAVHRARYPCAPQGAIRRTEGPGATAAGESRRNLSHHQLAESEAARGVRGGNRRAVNTVRLCSQCVARR